MSTELVVVEAGPIGLPMQLVPVEYLVARQRGIHQVMQEVMVEGHHYGKIPGSDKPSLLKPGAEIIAASFRLSPTYEEVLIESENGHREYRVRCILLDHNGTRVGEGLGTCSTLESKYRYRQGARKCPSCGKETIIKGKEEYGGGWICFVKKSGCGAKYGNADASIVDQVVGLVEHQNPADFWNTVQKMAAKRAFVDAVKTTTAASDVFTQDVEEMRENDAPLRDARQAPPPTSSSVKTNGTEKFHASAEELADLRKLAKEVGVKNQTVVDGCRKQLSGTPSEIHIKEFDLLWRWVSVGCPEDWDSIDRLEEEKLAEACRATDGMELPRWGWEVAERLVAKGGYSLSPPRGPGGDFRRLTLYHDAEATVANGEPHGAFDEDAETEHYAMAKAAAKGGH